MKKKTILITGTNGFIAKNLIFYLKNKNLNIISTSKYLQNSTYVFNFDEAYKSKIHSLKFDILIHLAYVKKNSFLEEKKKNYESSKVLFEVSKNNNSKIIYISSQSASIDSLSNYGKIKHSIEELAKNYNCTIIRPGLVYKKNSFDGIFGIIKKLIIGYPIIFFPSGLNKKICLCDMQILLEYICSEITNNNQKLKFVDIDDKKTYNLKNLILKIIKDNNKKRILLPINYLFFFYTLKILEILKINIKLKSDSLMSLK